MNTSFRPYSEAEFINELARQSGCGILLDVNNVYVSCRNHGWNALDYLQAIRAEKVGEIHLAGHSINRVGEQQIMIDTHDGPVCAAVWQLYQTSIQLLGSRPTLIEWDADLPSWQRLIAEAETADGYLEQVYEQAA